jgi:hypothetical protein
MDVREAWNRLATIRELLFDARSHSATSTGWTGSGRGSVQVEMVDERTMLFIETGSWTTEQDREIAFNNVFRWTAVLDQQLIRLEHLRFGPRHPVYLFDLVPVSDRILESGTPHVCRKDLYSARLEFEEAAVRLIWTVIGPKKDERISYAYR